MPRTLAVFLALVVTSVALAQGVLSGPADSAIATRGVTAWWGNTYPKTLTRQPPCALMSRDRHESALLTCYGALGLATAQASRVTSWQWACPEQAAVRARCPLMGCLQPWPCVKHTAGCPRMAGSGIPARLALVREFFPPCWQTGVCPVCGRSAKEAVPGCGMICAVKAGAHKAPPDRAGGRTAAKARGHRPAARQGCQ